MRKRIIFLNIVVLTAIMVVSATGFAASISLNFSENSGNQRFTGGELIGPLKTDSTNWNMSDDFETGGLPSGTISDLIDDTGANTGISVSWNSSNTYWQGDGTADDEHKLAVGYLDDGTTSGSIGVDITFENIPYGVYRVYGLFASDWGDVNIRNFSVNGQWVLGGNDQTVVAANPTITTNNTANGEYWTLIESGSEVIGNYWVIDTSGSTLTIHGLPKSDSLNARGSITAVIIERGDPFVAYNPTPANGSEVPITQIVSWQQLDEISGLGVTYNVYFGTEPNELNPNYYGLTPVKTTTDDSADFFYDPGTLPNSTPHYWRVDTIDPNDGHPFVHTGPEWWFTTQPKSAQIKTDPASQTVAAGSEVQFSVAGINIETYQWYKDGVALDDPTDTLYVGEDTATLTVKDVQIDDEGFYYCEGDNSLNEPDASAAVQLLTERLIGHWKLDADLTDSVDSEVAGATGHDGVSIDPNYVAVGKDGGALQFYGDIESLVTISDSNDFFNFYPQGYTVSVWIKTTQTGWGAYVAKEERPGDPWKGFILTQNEGNAIHTLRQSFGDLASNTPVADDGWHFVTGTYDAATKEIKVYVDGVLRNQATGTDTPAPNQGALIFGDESTREEDDFARYIGLLDDIRIWSYPLDPVTVATMYVDFNPGEEVCVANPEYDVAGPDGVGDEFRDCRVDLYDLMPFAQVWLDCNIVPDCLP